MLFPLMSDDALYFLWTNCRWWQKQTYVNAPLGYSLLSVCEATLQGLCLVTLCHPTQRGLLRISPHSFSFSPSHFTSLDSLYSYFFSSSSPSLPLSSCPTSSSPPDQPPSPHCTSSPSSIPPPSPSLSLSLILAMDVWQRRRLVLQASSLY